MLAAISRSGSRCASSSRSFSQVGAGRRSSLTTDNNSLESDTDQQGEGQPEQLSLPNEEHAVQVQPRCRCWASLVGRGFGHQWPPLVEDAYVEFKYHALHVPHFFSTLAVFICTALFAVLW